MSRLARVRSHHATELGEAQWVLSEAGRFSSPEELALCWADAPRLSLPCTVAQVLAAEGRLSLSEPPLLDDQDCWLRAVLPSSLEPGVQVLCFEGLATLADVWIDGQHQLRSENMFRRHGLELPALRGGAELVVRFASLSAHLKRRRPRPRWRTRLVDQQQLRWVRTTLLGRTPGFCPRVPPVGPYRPIVLEARADAQVREASLGPTLAGEEGTLELALRLEPVGARELSTEGRLFLSGSAWEGSFELSGERDATGVTFRAALSLGKVARWWPHTHGAQPQSEARFALASGEVVELGKVAFRQLRLDRGPDGSDFALHINGERVFCRGACWTTDEVLGLGSAGLRATLAQVRDAGMNMLRVGGTAAYESPAFYDLCDELGILVFQDLMFANMCYPAEDEAFMKEVRAEVTDLLTMIGERPCLALLCGGSEVEQQAAMMGLTAEERTSSLFHEALPALVGALSPAVPYVSSTPSGGALPFQVNAGLSHYYGVGAYLRPLEDARRAEVKFAAECLAFANPPAQATIERFMGDLDMPFHHPRWKERVPRDRGVGWDFEDVNDHYIERLFEVEPRRVRYGQPERYLELSRAAVCSAMEATFAEWRRHGSRCAGGLVFWLKDLWAGAGWGVIDAHGLPKAPYYALRRSFAPCALFFTDEGLNGLDLHVVHEPARSLDVELELRLFRGGEALVSELSQPLTLRPRHTERLSVEALMSRFSDVGYAYRFGPPSHDVVFARLSQHGEELARAFFLPLGEARSQELDLGLAARFVRRGEQLGVEVTTRRFAQRVALDIDGYLPSDDRFHLAPGDERWIALCAAGQAPTRLWGSVGALNSLVQVQVAAE